MTEKYAEDAALQLKKTAASATKTEFKLIYM